MSYQVGVDPGATFTAVCRAGGTPPEIVPTVVFVNPDGTLRIGADADRLGLRDPQRVVRQFIRRIGDGVPILAGDVSWPAEMLAARLVAGLLPRPADRVTLTHPAGWGTHRVAAFRDALATVGVPGARFLPAPVAAVLAHSTRERIEPGGTVAVYDLGGSGFEAAMVRRDTMDQFTVAGAAEDLELGGLDFDEVIFGHVTASLGAAWERLDPADPVIRAAVAGLRRGCTAGKEALSVDTSVLIPVSLPGIETSVRLTRAEFEDAIGPAIDETVAALGRAITSAGVQPDLVLLTGGSARIPLVTQTVSERLGRPVTVAFDPRGIVAAGAAIDARGPAVPPTRIVPTPVEPLRIVPPPLSGPPRATDSGRWLGLPRPVAAVAAALLATGVAAVLTLMARHTAPASSDADTSAELSPKTAAVQEEPTTTTTQAPPARNRPPATATRTQKPATSAPPPRTTTTTAPTDSTSRPPTSTTTTTTRPSSPTAATSSQEAAR